MNPMMNPTRNGSPPFRRQSGVSLTEVMVSLVMGLMVTAAVVQIYLSSRRNQSLQESLTARQEAARYAAAIIQGDAQLAGFRGCLRDVGNVVNTLNDAADFRYDFARPVQGFNGGGGAWSPALPATLAAAAPIPGTDVLTLRAAEDPGVFLTGAMGASDGDLTTLAGLPAGILQTNDLVLVSDCGGAAIFQVTNFDLDSGTVSHAAGPGAPGNAATDLARRFSAGSQLFRLQTSSYFIAPASDDTPETDRRSLWRQSGNGPPQELAPGVENLQVLFGEDEDGDQAPDVYRRADEVVDWRDVVSLQVALLAAGLQERVTEADPREFALLDAEVGPFDDGRIRRAVTFTVALRNRLS